MHLLFLFDDGFFSSFPDESSYNGLKTSKTRGESLTVHVLNKHVVMMFKRSREYQLWHGSNLPHMYTPYTRLTCAHC